MTLELPLTLVSEVRRSLEASVRESRSPASGAGQVQDWLGEWWAYSLTFGIHTRAEGRQVSAFFDRLRGPATPFPFRDPSFQASVAGAVTPTASGGWIGAESIPTFGWAPNATIPAGTFFNIGSGADTRLHRVVADAVADASGVVWLTIAPRLRAPILTLTPLVFSAPRVLLRLRGPVPSVITRAETYTFSVEAREAL